MARQKDRDRRGAIGRMRAALSLIALPSVPVRAGAGKQQEKRGARGAAQQSFAYPRSHGDRKISLPLQSALNAF
jgi:hypothetical protein